MSMDSHMLTLVNLVQFASSHCSPFTIMSVPLVKACLLPLPPPPPPPLQACPLVKLSPPLQACPLVKLSPPLRACPPSPCTRARPDQSDRTPAGWSDRCRQVCIGIGGDDRQHGHTLLPHHGEPRSHHHLETVCLRRVWSGERTAD